MKTRFSTYDIICTVTELQKYVGFRVNNIYDIDPKTYLIRLTKNDERCVVLLESGARFHKTNYEWPKNTAPSGFSMKLRKHLRNKRLECLKQLGLDRIVDLQFGTGEAEYHIILELYDKGNVILTDFEYTILNVLRPHTEGEDVRFFVRGKYPLGRARVGGKPNFDDLKPILEQAQSSGNQLKKVLLPHLDYGPALIEHALQRQGFANNTKIGKNFSIDTDFGKLVAGLQEAQEIFEAASSDTSKGYIIQKQEIRASASIEQDEQYFYSNQEFHPFLFEQHRNSPYKEFETFNMAVDEFFSTMEGQKIEMAAVQQEKAALKKLENVRKDHSQRLDALEKDQIVDKQKAELISRNADLVDEAIIQIHKDLASQMSWQDINDLLRHKSQNGDPIAKHIKELKLEINSIVMELSDPYGEDLGRDVEENEDLYEEKIPTMLVVIDLYHTAYSNATRYYDLKKYAAKKQQKTVESQKKALKSAEKKTIQTLKQVQITTSIKKARKVFWFEKFFWFISSENYLVIAGRDQQQNELIVKRYMKPKDVYVHGDIHGASTVVIKNPTGQAVPPKTLNEAGTMAICYSVAWEAKVITNAYWVWGGQVTKTAPSGEYLTTGSFMIRGTKHFLPTSVLVLGFSFLFRFDEGNLQFHKDERKVFIANEELVLSTPFGSTAPEEIDEEIDVKSDNENEDFNGETVVVPSEDSDENPTLDFPDTQIDLGHFVPVSKSNSGLKGVLKLATDNQEEFEFNDQVENGRNEQKVQFSLPKSRNTNENNKELDPDSTENCAEPIKQQTQQIKRGQKSKLKKIKEKYKDQDEEERALRMQILQSAGPSHPKKRDKKKKKGNSTISLSGSQQQKSKPKPVQNRPKDENPADEELEEPIVQAELDMIDFLTGIPRSEDELLFAVPIVAPYTALANYKFKVKMTPGTGKRGRAAKTALNVFLQDKSATSREKDLLKSVKDDQLARNIPGKVKLSAPKLQAAKK